MKVRELMTENVATTAPDTTLEEVARLMKDEDTGAIPVVEDDELLGIVTDRDIVVRGIAEGNDPFDCTVQEILSGDLETIEPDADADEAAGLMARRQIRRLPVVENGRLMGMLSLGDIAVKERDEKKTHNTLAEVSQGAKKSGAEQRAAARSQAARAAHPRAARGQRGSPRQGIGNRPAPQEIARQEKVVPIRADSSAAPRKRKRSRRKAS